MPGRGPASVLQTRAKLRNRAEFVYQLSKLDFDTILTAPSGTPKAAHPETEDQNDGVKEIEQ